MLAVSACSCLFWWRLSRSGAGAASATANAKSSLDVPQLFATTCGWCHTDGGRAAGKGPQLMNTERSDDFIRNRIKNGKEGAMPAFGSTIATPTSMRSSSISEPEAGRDEGSRMIRRRAGSAVLASLALARVPVHAASARTLAEIHERGTIGLCAHPNSLPFASRTAEQPQDSRSSSAARWQTGWECR